MAEIGRIWQGSASQINAYKPYVVVVWLELARFGGFWQMARVRPPKAGVVGSNPAGRASYSKGFSRFTSSVKPAFGTILVHQASYPQAKPLPANVLQRDGGEHGAAAVTTGRRRERHTSLSQ